MRPQDQTPGPTEQVRRLTYIVIILLYLVNRTPLGQVRRRRVDPLAVESRARSGMAAVLLHNMKAMKALAAEYGEASGAVAELRAMTRLYLASKLRRKS